MSDENEIIRPEPPTERETYRTVHEILAHIARVLAASSDGLGMLAVDPQTSARDSMMLTTLSQARAEAAGTVQRIADSARRHDEGTWLQYAYAPIFGARPDLAATIASSRSGEAAYEIISEIDTELENALQHFSTRTPDPSEFLQQTESVVVQLQRSSRTIVESAQDI